MERSKKRARESTDTQKGTCSSAVQETPVSTPSFFQALLGVTETTFFDEYFEKKPLLYSPAVKSSWQGRVLPMCFQPLDWSSQTMLRLVREKSLCYTTDINVVKYDRNAGARIPYKTSGKVDVTELQRCFQDGSWSVRFLRPQEHSPSVTEVVATMESIFSCSCGVNSYWTPRNSQGFAPHYDDVDVFLLQLEGSKRWRLYHPPQDVDVLSRHSSEDYAPHEIGSPFMEFTLRAGDALYMPRGVVHQGDTVASGEDSLHVTFSASQMHSYADLMLKLTSYHIETLAANDVEWRRSVPRSCLRVCGFSNSRAFAEEHSVCALSPSDAPLRSRWLKEIRALLAKLSTSLNEAHTIDHCVDQFAVDVLSRCQPLQARPSSSRETSLNDEHTSKSSWDRHSKVRFRSLHAQRLVMSVPNEARLYYCHKNSPICLAQPVGMLRFDLAFAASLAYLQRAYPAFVPLSSLPLVDEEEVGGDAGDWTANVELMLTPLLNAGIVEVEP